MTKQTKQRQNQTKTQSIRESDWLPNLSLGGSLLGSILFLAPYLGLPIAISSIIAGFTSTQDTSKNTAGIIIGFIQIPIHLAMLILVGAILTTGTTT